MFVRDRQSGVTERVSVGIDGAEGNSTSDMPAISADGRFVAFRSYASNLVADDTNGNAVGDVFVRHRQSGVTERVNVDPGGAQANMTSYRPAVSADGRFVAFGSVASNLVAGDTNGRGDLFVRDRHSGSIERVDVGFDGTEANAGFGAVGAISADGRFVAFDAGASNLVAGDTNAAADVFVRDRAGEGCTITGGPGDDVLAGTAGGDVICGLDGNDILRGGDGDDVLRGGDGNDDLDAGAGRDGLAGDAGSDHLAGGSGADAFAGGTGVDRASYWAAPPRSRRRSATAPTTAPPASATTSVPTSSSSPAAAATTRSPATPSPTASAATPATTASPAARVGTSSSAATATTATTAPTTQATASIAAPASTPCSATHSTGSPRPARTG